MTDQIQKLKEAAEKAKMSQSGKTRKYASDYEEAKNDLRDLVDEETVLSLVSEVEQLREKLERIKKQTVDSGSLRGLKISYEEHDNRFYAYAEDGKFLWSGEATFNVWRCVRFEEERKESRAQIQSLQRDNEAIRKALENANLALDHALIAMDQDGLFFGANRVRLLRNGNSLNPDKEGV